MTVTTPSHRIFTFSFKNKALAVSLLFPALALAGCNAESAPEAKLDRPVLVSQVHYRLQNPDRSFVGTVQPRIESNLGFRVGGKVSKRLVEVGAIVEPGQPLATLDEVDLKLQLDQADAELNAATGVQAQAAAADRRARELRQKGWSTDAQLEQSKAGADEAQARLNRAQRAVELARNALSYATLTADARGVVTDTQIEPGQVVASGQTAIRVAQLNEKDVVVAIPETLVARARGGTAQVTLWSAPDTKYAAQLRELAPSADPATRTYLAKFKLLDANAHAQFGMTATLTLSDGNADRVAVLPLSALFSQGEGASLYVVDKTGALSLRPIKVKGYDGNSVLVASGVEDGENVVTLGVQKLDPAQRVRVVSALSF